MATSSEKPVGTPDELKLLNKPLSEWGSCAPDLAGFGKGCGQYRRCIFALPENGGFRDQGPRNIGVLKVNNETGVAREDVTECHVYMQYMHDHNKVENAVMHYAVIAQEGETINVDQTVPVDRDNTRTGNMKMKTETVAVVVPKFPRPGMPGSKVEPQMARAQATLRRHAERAAKARQNENLMRSLSPLNQPQPEPDAFAAGSPTQMAPPDPAPAPTPVKRGPGRPPKPR